MTFKVNGTPVITSDRRIQNITAFRGNMLFSGSQRQKRIALADWTIDCSRGNYFTKTVSSTGIFSFVNFPAERAYGFVLEVKHEGGIIGWPEYVHWSNGADPLLEVNKTHLFAFIKDSQYEWRGAFHINYSM